MFIFTWALDYRHYIEVGADNLDEAKRKAADNILNQPYITTAMSEEFVRVVNTSTPVVTEINSYCVFHDRYED